MVIVARYLPLGCFAPFTALDVCVTRNLGSGFAALLCRAVDHPVIQTRVLSIATPQILKINESSSLISFTPPVAKMYMKDNIHNIICHTLGMVICATVSKHATRSR
jgi:hypothetical protein